MQRSRRRHREKILTHRQTRISYNTEKVPPRDTIWSRRLQTLLSKKVTNLSRGVNTNLPNVSFNSLPWPVWPFHLRGQWNSKLPTIVNISNGFSIGTLPSLVVTTIHCTGDVFSRESRVGICWPPDTLSFAGPWLSDHSSGKAYEQIVAFHHLKPTYKLIDICLRECRNTIYKPESISHRAVQSRSSFAVRNKSTINDGCPQSITPSPSSCMRMVSFYNSHSTRQLWTMTKSTCRTQIKFPRPCPSWTFGDRINSITGII